MFSLLVAPKLKLFDKKIHVLSGDSVGLTCIAEAGDAPLSFLWTKDQSPTKSLPGLEVGQSNIYSSLLGISEATSNHSGTYSCTISNSVGIASTTVLLQVDGNVISKFRLLTLSLDQGREGPQQG